MQVAVLLPSCVVAAMVAVPALTGVTTPLVAMVTFVLLLAQVTTWFAAMFGTTVASRTAGSPPVVKATTGEVLLFRSDAVNPVTDTLE